MVEVELNFSLFCIPLYLESSLVYSIEFKGMREKEKGTKRKIERNKDGAIRKKLRKE
jgi:hypothetical protein